MSTQTKIEYLKRLRERYKLCISRKDKSLILDELVNNFKIYRKSAIRLVNKRCNKNRPIRKQKEVKYTEDLVPPLRLVWTVCGKPCSKRLQPQIKETLNKLKQFDEIKIHENQDKLLCSMSNFTIDKLLKDIKEEEKKYPTFSGTRKSPLLKTLIPIRCDFYDVKGIPGNVELDCVLHCGESLLGSYAETLNMLDIETHWNEKMIFMNKTRGKILGAIHILSKQFPFKILSIDFDNGWEFVNWLLHSYCIRENIKFTRSRSYHKNDQAHIEGKNYQSVRRVSGYERIDNIKAVELLNNIYQQEHRLLTNFFYTTLKLKNKTRINGKVTKEYEIAKTPYQRVLESDKISEETKQRLREEYNKLNIAELNRNLDKKMREFKILLGNNYISSNDSETTNIR